MEGFPAHQWRLASVLWLWTAFLASAFSPTASIAASNSKSVCIIGSGIGGASLAHFLRAYEPYTPMRIIMFEKNQIVGGRMSTVTVSCETFEAGASILHPLNYHVSNFTQMLNLKRKPPPSSETDFSLGIWNGRQFLFKTISSNSKLPFINKIVRFANAAFLFLRYGFSLFRMNGFVEDTVNKFLKFYQKNTTRPEFKSVEDMLKWAGLYNLTARTLNEQLIDIGLSPLLIQELITVIMRINYGQSCQISGLAGAVSLAGSSDGLWAVEGGNWLVARGLISASDVELHLDEEISSVSLLGEKYEMNSTRGRSYTCNVAVVASPLDEQNIQFNPAISIPSRKMQHTHATFVRGVINPGYFGLKSVSEVPELVGTIEDATIPFSSISVLKRRSDNDVFYKIFSRDDLPDNLLEEIFRERKETTRINWAAYPQYEAPEVYAPFVLDNHHLYYVNAFENAASTMETSAVAAENVARLIISRFFGHPPTSHFDGDRDDDGRIAFHSDL